MNKQTQAGFTTPSRRRLVRGLTGAALLTAGVCAWTDSAAMFHPATVRTDACQFQISDVSMGGKALSYEAAAQLKDAYTSVARARTVYTPRLTLADGRQTHLAIEKDGCARAITNKAYFAEPLRRVRGAGLRG